MESGYKINEVMQRTVCTTDHTTPVATVAQQMNEKRIGSVILLHNGQPYKIITEQDIVRKIVSQGKDPTTTQSGDVAEQSLISIGSNRDLYDATTLMGTHEIKHLPVIDNGELQGIITAKDIIRLEPHLIEMLTFKSSMDKEEAKKLFDKL